MSLSLDAPAGSRVEEMRFFGLDRQTELPAANATPLQAMAECIQALSPASTGPHVISKHAPRQLLLDRCRWSDNYIKASALGYSEVRWHTPSVRWWVLRRVGRPQA